MPKTSLTLIAFLLIATLVAFPQQPPAVPNVKVLFPNGGNIESLQFTIVQYGGTDAVTASIDLLSGDRVVQTLRTDAPLSGQEAKVVYFDSKADAGLCPSGCRIRVHVNETGYEDTSDLPFIVTGYRPDTPDRWVVKFPNLPLTLIAGHRYTIAVDHPTGHAATYPIQLLRNGELVSTFDDWAADNQPVVWTVPRDLPPGSGYRVRAGTGAGVAESDYDFTIAPPDDQLISDVVPDEDSDHPNATDAVKVFEPGSSVTLHWFSATENARLELLKYDQLVGPLFSGDRSQGIFHSWPMTWTIPPNHGLGPTYQIRATSATNPAAVALSEPFWIEKNPTLIQITSPKAGDSWQPGTTQTITWTSDGGRIPVAIWITKRNQPVYKLTSGVPLTTGSFTFTVPNAPAGLYSIRLSTTTSPARTAVMYGSIGIPSFTPLLRIVSPNGGEQFQPGDTVPIVFDYLGKDGATIKLDLMNDLALHGTLTSALPTGTGTRYQFNWKMNPATWVGSRYRIRATINERGVTPLAQVGTSDASDSYFGIGATPVTDAEKARIQLEYPAGGETLGVGLKQYAQLALLNYCNVFCETSSTIRFQLWEGDRYFADVPINQVWQPSAGSYIHELLLPPFAAGRNVKLKALFADDPEIAAESASFFASATLPTFTSPTGGETWLRGTTHPIQWTSDGLGLGLYSQVFSLDLLQLDPTQGTTLNTFSCYTALGFGGFVYKPDWTTSHDCTIPSTAQPGTYVFRLTGADDNAARNLVVTSTSFTVE